MLFLVWLGFSCECLNAKEREWNKELYIDFRETTDISCCARKPCSNPLFPLNSLFSCFTFLIHADLVTLTFVPEVQAVRSKKVVLCNTQRLK